MMNKLHTNSIKCPRCNAVVQIKKQNKRCKCGAMIIYILSERKIINLKILNGMRIRTDDNFEGFVIGHGWMNRKQTIAYETFDNPPIARMCYRYQVIEFQLKSGDWVPYRALCEKRLDNAAR